MIELNQSWAGPYHAPGYTVSKLDPMQREWEDVKEKHEAKPLLDELAVVAFDEDATDSGEIWARQDESTKQAYRNMVLSVARRLLEREACEGEVSAFIRAYWAFEGTTTESYSVALKASRLAQLAELEGK